MLTLLPEVRVRSWPSLRPLTLSQDIVDFLFPPEPDHWEHRYPPCYLPEGS